MSTLDAFSRIITHHTVTIDTRFRTQSLDNTEKSQCTCRVPSMRDLAPLIKAKKGTVHTYEKGDVILTLQDVKYYPPKKDTPSTHLCLLVNAVDKNGSTTVLKNTQTQERVEISPKHEEGEGYEVSSHIIIKLDNAMRTYDMSFMPIPGISTSRMNSFLNRILYLAAKDNEDLFTAKSVTNIVSSTTNQPIKVRYKPVFEIIGKLDQELFNKINQECLSDVILMKNEFSIINAPDVNTAIVPKESTLRLTPNHGKSDVIGWLKGISNYFKEDANGGYDSVKIKFKEPETGATRQVDFQTSNIRLDGLEKTFVKKSVLNGFSSRLKDSYDTIDIEFVSKIIASM